MENNKKYKGVFPYQTKNGTMYQVTTTFISKDGYKKLVCKKGFKTAKQADNWKNEERSRWKELTLSELEMGKAGFESALVKYLEYKSNMVKSGTLRDYKYRLEKSFMPFVKDKRTEDLTISDLEKIYSSIASKDTNAITKNTFISTILTFLEYLDLMEMLNNGIYKKAKLMFLPFNQSREKKAHYIEHEDFKMLIESFDENTLKDNTYVLMLNLLMFTGSRISEILGIRYDDLTISFDEMTNEEIYTLHIDKQTMPRNEFNAKEAIYTFKNAVIVPYTKTNAVKDIILPRWIGESILEHKELNTIQSKGFVFSIVKNRIIQRESAYEVITTRAEKLGIEHFRLHDFRGTHITDLYEMGASGKYVQERVGHSNEMTSRNIYQTISEKRKTQNDNLIKNLKY